MDKETLFPFYQRIMPIIDRYRKDRTIVLLGDFKPFQAFLTQTYGLSDCMVITTVKKKASDKLVYIGDIKNQNDRYYIIVPHFKKTLDMQLRLHSFGYTDFEDCFFINHDRITVNSYIDDYSDEYGNHIHAPSCDVVLDEYAYNVTVDIDKTCTFGETSAIYVKTFGGAHVTIGRKCVFEEGVTLTVFGDAEVNIGANCTFVRNTEMIVLAGMRLDIGKDCLFSCEIKVYGGDGHAIYDLVEKKRLNPQNKDNPKNLISIGDHVWVGMRSILLNRTVIGNSCIVGAGTIVKGTFPNNCMIAGIPASIIRKNITWSKESLRNSMDHIPPEYLTLTDDTEI